MRGKDRIMWKLQQGRKQETQRPCPTKVERRQPWDLPSDLHLCAVAYAHVHKMTQINMKKKKQIIL